MLQIESVSKQYSTRVLLENATAHLRPGSRVGLVGPNGAGKTTLFRMILGEESPDEGTIRKRPRLRIGYLPQELETITGKNVLDATHRDIYPEHEAERILMGLGFSELDFGREVEKLSGGYRMRVALAHLLLSKPDVLMLDEPTNHLDKPTQRWFEQFLLDSEMTLLIISHDTEFLNRVVTHIWDLRHHKIEEYRGSYTSFQKIRAERDAQQEAAAGRQAKEVARVQTFVDRFRYQANKASQVQSRIKQLDKVKMIEVKRDPKRVKFKFPIPAERPAGAGDPGRVQTLWRKSDLRESRLFDRAGPARGLGRRKRGGQKHAAQNAGRGAGTGQRQTVCWPWCHPALLRPAPGGNTKPRTYDSGIPLRGFQPGGNEFPPGDCRRLSVHR